MRRRLDSVDQPLPGRTVPDQTRIGRTSVWIRGTEQAARNGRVVVVFAGWSDAVPRVIFSSRLVGVAERTDGYMVGADGRLHLHRWPLSPVSL